MNVQEYLTSLSDNVEFINLASFGLTTLPDLSRFTKLKTLYCSWNHLTTIPVILSLKRLCCKYNQLTSIPVLPNLEELYCCHNQLTSIPILPKLKTLFCVCNRLINIPVLPNLKSLYCCDNTITIIPELPTLKYLYCKNNPINELIGYEYSEEHIYRFYILNKKLHRFRDLYYAIQYCKPLKNFLWDRVRRPKIEAQYHPDKLVQFMEEHPDDWDEKMDTW